MRHGQRRAAPRDMVDEFELGRVHHLEGREPSTAALPETDPAPPAPLPGLRPPARHCMRRGQRMQLQHRGSDDAERAFRADEEVLQVVAGVVLAQR